MLDPKYFQDSVADLENALKRRNADPQFIKQISELARSRRGLMVNSETLKAQRNKVSQEIAQLKAKAKSDPAAGAEADKRVLEMRAVGEEIKKLDDELKTVDEKFQHES